MKKTTSKKIISERMSQIADQTFRHIKAAQANFRAAESSLLEHYEKARKQKNDELLDFISGQLVFVYTMAGWTKDAYDLLLKREKEKPSDLHAKLRMAQFYFRHGGDYLSALRK